MKKVRNIIVVKIGVDVGICKCADVQMRKSNGIVRFPSREGCRGVFIRFINTPLQPHSRRAPSQEGNLNAKINLSNTSVYQRHLLLITSKEICTFVAS
jgi:hypothetical protein